MFIRIRVRNLWRKSPDFGCTQLSNPLPLVEPPLPQDLLLLLLVVLGPGLAVVVVPGGARPAGAAGAGPAAAPPAAPQDAAGPGAGPGARPGGAAAALQAGGGRAAGPRHRRHGGGTSAASPGPRRAVPGRREHSASASRVEQLRSQFYQRALQLPHSNTGANMLLLAHPGSGITSEWFSPPHPTCFLQTCTGVPLPAVS